MSSPLQTPRTAARKANERSVLSVIFQHGPLSRVKVATLTGLSKPTVSSIVDDLVGAGLVQPHGRTKGRVGRAATLFHIDGSVAYVVALDVGGRNIRVAVGDIHGAVVGERTVGTNARSPEALERQIVEIVRTTADDAGVPWPSVRVVTVGVPGAVDQETGSVRLAPNIPALSGVRLRRQLGGDTERTVILENDVNLAAVGERRQGFARDIDNFVFIAVGTGVGAGLFIDGRLCRGAGGGTAGEIGFLPLGDDPFEQRHQVRGALEETTSGPGIAREARRRLDAGAESILSPDCDALEVFNAAAAKDVVALDVVDHAARYLALAIASVATVISPELVILGGGVGANPQLLAPVRRYVGQLLPEPVRVEQTAMETRAALTGALAVSLAAARVTVLSLPEEEGVGMQVTVGAAEG
jgi:predicted NBD/HSP70 family sugar kinase